MIGKQVAILILVAVLLLILTACAAGPNAALNTPNERGDVAGFWQGLWHGVISPLTFIISLFNGGVTIYDVNNNGHWYDFGFVLGVAIIFGGPAGSRRR